MIAKTKTEISITFSGNHYGSNLVLRSKIVVGGKNFVEFKPHFHLKRY